MPDQTTTPGLWEFTARIVLKDILDWIGVIETPYERRRDQLCKQICELLAYQTTDQS